MDKTSWVTLEDFGLGAALTNNDTESAQTGNLDIPSASSHQPACSEQQSCPLNDLDLAVGALEAVNRKNETHPHWNPGWELPLEFAPDPTNPSVGAQPGILDGGSTTKWSFSVPTTDQTYGSDVTNAHSMQHSIHDVTKVIPTTAACTPASGGSLLADVVNPTIPNSKTSSTSSTVQASRKPSKRKRISSFLSRKKQHVTPSKPSPIDQPATQTISLIMQAPSCTPSPPTIACVNERALELPTPHKSRVIETDWIEDWERVNKARLGTDGVSALRDVNIASRDRRPMSWPRRNNLRKSLDISVAVLTKQFEKKLRTEEESQRQPSDCSWL